MRFDVITLFSELFAPFLASGITRRVPTPRGRNEILLRGLFFLRQEIRVEELALQSRVVFAGSLDGCRDEFADISVVSQSGERILQILSPFSPVSMMS